MTLSESTVSNAIRYSMRKNCFANLVIAGPVGAGKKRLAHLIAECSDVYGQESNVTIFCQDDYYKEYDELEDTCFGVKNIDSESAFNTKRFVRDVRTFYENGHVSVCAYSRKNWSRAWKNDPFEENKAACILETKTFKRVNIFVGSHAIELLKTGIHTTRKINEGNNEDSEKNVSPRIVPYVIPEAIYIYINTNHEVWMERRERAKLMFPNSLIDVKLYREYSSFVESIVENEIMPQMKMADIVINCN